MRGVDLLEALLLLWAACIVALYLHRLLSAIFGG